MSKRHRNTADTGTPERHTHGDVIDEGETIVAGVRRAQVRTQTVLDRYYYLHQLGDNKEVGGRNYARWQAGTQLMKDFHEAGMNQNVTALYGEWISSGSVETWCVGNTDVRARVRKALEFVGPIASQEVIQVCWSDKKVGRERMEILRRGLERLSRSPGYGY